MGDKNKKINKKKFIFQMSVWREGGTEVGFDLTGKITQPPLGHRTVYPGYLQSTKGPRLHQKWGLKIDCRVHPDFPVP